VDPVSVRSYRERRRRMCDRKRRVNWRTAHQAAEALRERGWETVHAYVCPYSTRGHVHVHVGKGEQECDG
jgi:hypothetical protein